VTKLNPGIIANRDTSLVARLKDLYWFLIGDHSSERVITRFLHVSGITGDSKILDVGCGYGRNLRAMSLAGYRATGIEINASIVSKVREQGFICYSPDDPELRETQWDAIVMSHIIEHFDYLSLFEMTKRYLELLRPGGLVIIATPLLNRHFYDNFDHVKPYSPIAIEEVFGLRGRQVQFQSGIELELLDLWIRRSPFELRFFPSLLRRKMSFAKMFIGFINVSLRFVHLSSFRFTGVADGWVGLYRRL